MAANESKIAGIFCLLACATATADGYFGETEDDFGDGTRYQLTLEDPSDAAEVSVVCVDGSGELFVQIRIRAVIFPDDADLSRKLMFLKMTHKFDTAPASHSSEWLMPAMEYHVAQLPTGPKVFVQEAAAASRLAVKQDTTGASYRFEITPNDQANLRKIAAACTR